MFYLDIQRTHSGWMASAKGLSTRQGCWDASMVYVIDKVEVNVLDYSWTHGPFARKERLAGSAQICDHCDRYIIKQSPGSSDVIIITHQPICNMTQTILSPSNIRILLEENTVEWWQASNHSKNNKKKNSPLQNIWNSVYPMVPWRKMFYDSNRN